MSLAKITNDRRAGVIAMHLSRILPPSLGYRLANLVANRMAENQDLPMVKGIRLNQWVVHQRRLSNDELNFIVRRVLENITHTLFDQFHYSTRADQLHKFIIFNDDLEELIATRSKERFGVVICGLHMSSFDLAFLALTSFGLKSIALTMPEANETITWQHEIRRRAGLEVLPATMSNLRLVIRRLQAGELVVTGIDRPSIEPQYHPMFFDLPSNLPVHHVQLALAAGVPIILLAPHRRSDGYFDILSSGFIELQKYPDRKSELLNNAERLLEIAEGFISHAPTQWTMFHPIWPGITIGSD